MAIIKLRSVTLACLLSILSTYSYANIIEFYHQRYLENKIPLKQREAKSITENYYQQLIDHHQPSLGMFAQRYYIDESFSNSNNSPVFFYICGEAACKKSALMGEIRMFAEKYHAKLVALEHRYYGVSQPFSSLTTNNLQYLTTDNALNDLAAFQTAISKEKQWTGKWVAFGGSYPGSLSAYYRLKHPELVVGSLASSAPVMAKEDFDEYDAHVTKVAGETCANHMRVAVKEVESALNDPTRMTNIKKMFNAEDIVDNTDFISMIAELGAAAIQYGMRDMACEILATSETPLKGYALAANYILARWGMTPKDLVFQGAVSTDPKDYQDGLGMRQWFYQTCTEYGYWQTAHADAAKSSRSSLINIDYYRNGCKRLFGKDFTTAIDQTNQTYYQPLFNHVVTNIYFTNGSTDPWSNLSMTIENGNSTNKNLTYYTIAGAAHCDDLHPAKESDSAELKLARQKLNELLSLWVK